MSVPSFIVEISQFLWIMNHGLGNKPNIQILVLKLPMQDMYESNLTLLEASQMQTTLHPIKIQHPTTHASNLYSMIKHIVHPHQHP